jgi:hypothetical protein
MKLTNADRVRYLHCSIGIVAPSSSLNQPDTGNDEQRRKAN